MSVSNDCAAPGNGAIGSGNHRRRREQNAAAIDVGASAACASGACPGKQPPRDKQDRRDKVQSAEACLDGYTGPYIVVTDEMVAEGDPMLAEFCDLAGRGGTHEESPWLVAEGPEGVRLLLGSTLHVERLLLKPSLLGSLRADLERRRRPPLVMLCQAGLMERVTGVKAKHASAVLALARRPEMPSSLHDLVATAAAARGNSGIGDWDSSSPELRVVVADGLDDEQLGALFRGSAAFGADMVLLSEDCGDHLSRRATRVAMGHAFHVPAMRGNAVDFLQQLRAEYGALTVAAAPAAGGPNAAPEDRPVLPLDELGAVPACWALAVGAAGAAASLPVRMACDLQVAVRTALPSRPLNVGVLTSILLYGLVTRETTTGDTQTQGE